MSGYNISVNTQIPDASNVYLLFYWHAASQPQQPNGKGRVLGPAVPGSDQQEDSGSSSEQFFTYSPNTQTSTVIAVT